MIFEKLWQRLHINAPVKKTEESGDRISGPTGEKDRRSRIMVFGDSNAYRPGNGRDCWPAMLLRRSGKTLWVINESCDGRTIRYDTGECNGLKVIGQKIRRAAPLNGVILALGTNDLKSKYGPPDAADIVEGMDNIIQTITRYNTGATPILLTPPPLGNVTVGDLANAQGRIPPLVAAYRGFAEKNNIPLVDINAIADITTDLEPDAIHLNATGRKKIANAVWSYIKDCRHRVKGDGL